MDLGYRTVNVFTIGDDPFSGNPLAVFPDAGSLDDRQMQAIARQLNLSETTFVTRVDPYAAEADVRIFTPAYELPFAGHPTLGTASVVAAVLGGRDEVTLNVEAGRVRVLREGSQWVLTTATGPVTRPVEATTVELASVLGLDVADLAADRAPLWVDTGVEQLILPLASADAVRNAQADPRLLRRYAMSNRGEALTYVWAPTGDDTIEARLFFTQGTAVIEDPATGSACANLGGWFHAQGQRGIDRVVRQGQALERPSELHLHLDADGTIRVGGTLRELGRGTFTL
ncbi:MAG: PhzF family phenazine biosynthesis protein [Lapillicoccus sp.]